MRLCRKIVLVIAGAIDFSVRDDRHQRQRSVVYVQAQKLCLVDFACSEAGIDRLRYPRSTATFSIDFAEEQFV
jgi:hypothetical protein